MEHKPNAQELTEQELGQASGAGDQGDWVCPECGSTEYSVVSGRELLSAGRVRAIRNYMCSRCNHTEKVR